MRQYQNRGGGGAGIGAFVGFLAGVGVGLLYAWQTGAETREQLADLFRKGRERGEGLARQTREQVENAKDAMTSEGGKEPFYESGKYT